MNKTLTAIVAVAFLAAVPVASAAASSLEPDARLNCTGQPTGIPSVDFAYQLSCALVGLSCDLVFNPCPLD